MQYNENTNLYIVLDTISYCTCMEETYIEHSVLYVGLSAQRRTLQRVPSFLKF